MDMPDASEKKSVVTIANKGVDYEWEDGRLYAVTNGKRFFKCRIEEKDVLPFLNRDGVSPGGGPSSPQQ